MVGIALLREARAPVCSLQPGELKVGCCYVFKLEESNCPLPSQVLKTTNFQISKHNPTYHVFHREDLTPYPWVPAKGQLADTDPGGLVPFEQAEAQDSTGLVRDGNW